MQTRINQKIILFLGMILISFTGFTAYGGHNKSELLENDSIFIEARHDFKVFTKSLYHTLGDTTLNYDAFEYAAKGYFNLLRKEKISKERFFTVIDFSQPSTSERLYIIDICYNRIIYKSIVAHGRNSGGLYARRFSNESNSHQSSIGFYLTSSTYNSRKYKLALRLDGLEYTNNRASSRGVVMHGADYATYEFLNKNGMLGRSYGCPAMPHRNFDEVVGWLKHGTCLFIYYPDRSYLRRSRLLNRKDYLTFFI